MSPTVLCILLQAVLDCGFFTVVGLLLIPYCVRSSWKIHPMNSPPLHMRRGLGYPESQQFANCSAMCLLVLSLIHTASATFDTRSIQINALNSNLILLILIFHGLIRSTAMISKETVLLFELVSVHSSCYFVYSFGTCEDIN